MIRLHRSRDNVEESEKHDVHTSPKSDSRGCVKCHSVDVATWTRRTWGQKPDRRRGSGRGFITKGHRGDVGDGNMTVVT